MVFHVAPDSHIKEGRVTDVYFERVRESLEKRGINPHVSMEVRANGLPRPWPWAVFTGLEELLQLMEGLPVDVFSMDEGTVFRAEEPVLTVSGRYLDFGVYETAMLGFICQASGIATNAARCRLAAGNRPVISFGARRMHPAMAPMIERNAFVGGCDGVAVVESAELLGIQPSGTMSHSLILCSGDERTAFEAFDEAVSPEVKRIALVDTFQDEKFGALFAAQVLGDRLFGVRLDTPGSRRGDFLKIIREVRWELDLRGYTDIKIFLSGGIDEYLILEYNEVADAYGVGTHISNSPVINFAMDIVEVDGVPRSKRGKESGRKQVWVCNGCGHREVLPVNAEGGRCPVCGNSAEPLLRNRLVKGVRSDRDPAPADVRRRVLEQLGALEL